MIGTKRIIIVTIGGILFWMAMEHFGVYDKIEAMLP